MTDFETAARAAGRVLADEWMQKNGGPQSNGHHIAHASIIYGFRAGAEWGAAQEPADAEVEALVDWLDWAIRGTTDGDLIDQDSELPVGEVLRLIHESARAALTAARQARQEKS